LEPPYVSGVVIDAGVDRIVADVNGDTVTVPTPGVFNVEERLRASGRKIFQSQGSGSKEICGIIVPKQAHGLTAAARSNGAESKSLSRNARTRIAVVICK
jgi:hypothetical protein